MNLSNNQITSKEAAALCGISVPTLFRFAGIKEGVNGVRFPQPEKISNRLFAWNKSQIEQWVATNGKAPKTNRGRPKGSPNVNHSTASLGGGFQYQYSLADE